MSRQTVRHPGEMRWETNLLAVTTLTLTGFGVINCYATGTYVPKWQAEASQQLSAALIGGVVFLVAAYLDYDFWRRVAKPMFYATIAGLLALAIVATLWPKKAPGLLGQIFPVHNGAHRWIVVGIQIQVSEIARFTVAAYLAMRAAEMGNRIRRFGDGFGPLIGILGFVVLLLIAEPAVSMSIILAGIGGVILFTAGARIAHIAPAALLGLGAVFLGLKFDEVRSARVELVSAPALQCDVLEDQACKSLIGLGTGGITGVGFGEGTQKLGHLPYGYSDFILSVIGEEWGFLGVAFVVILFTLFCWMGFRIARTSRDLFGTLLASGLTAAVAGTALLHAAVVLRMGPTTGLTLPFMSAGRVSLILYMFCAGVVVNIGRRRGRPVRAR